MNFFNKEQRVALSSLFINIAVGYFTALFIVPNISHNVSWLILVIYIGNIFIAILIALELLKEEL